MRIIAGKYKGRRIDFPGHIRPTQDRVRQSVFDVLAEVIEGSRVLDLFSGSGAFGLEALSRGASSVVFVEVDRRCSLIIRRNLEKIGLAGLEDTAARNYTQDTFRAIRILEKRKEAFDLVFLDPPYGKGLVKKALKTLSESGILPLRSFVVAEHARKDDLGAIPEGWRLVKEIGAGDVKVSFFQLRT